MTITEETATGTVLLSTIYVPQNVRDLDADHVDALAGSIALQGLLQPVIVTPAVGAPADAGYEFVLTAGFHRHAAVLKLGHAEIDAVLRHSGLDAGGVDVVTVRATENIARKQLDAYEEATAVRAMLESGLTQDGVGQALGWSKARVTARVKLLELPELAQQLVGRGVIPLSAVDVLRGVGQVSSQILDAVIGYVADGGDWVGEKLHTDLGYIVSRALVASESKVFAEFLTSINADQVQALKLGKKATAELEEISELFKKANPWSYGPPAIRFSESEIDQARAAGVLIESTRSPLIVDRPLFRELVKQALSRTVAEQHARIEEVAEQRSADREVARAERAADPETVVNRDHGRRMREIAADAHGVNVDVGWGLRNGLACVDPADMTVAKFFVYALLGPDHNPAGFGTGGEQVLELAMTGVRLVVDEFRADITAVKKDGSRGRLRISYGDPRQPEEPVAWMWTFIDGARSAGDLYGRALVVIAAEQYASRLVLPKSEQHAPIRWRSHKDQAAKALAKLAGPHLPVTLKQLEKAINVAGKRRETELAAARAATPSDGQESEDMADGLDGDREDGEALAA